MSFPAFNISQESSVEIAPLQVGAYLTDGLRLLCVVGIDGQTLRLEDACTECLEHWPLDDAVTSMREVKPWT